MNTDKKAKRGFSLFASIIFPIIFFLFVFSIFIYGINNIKDATSEQTLNAIHQSITRSAVHCYATEGFYPESLTYLENHYGLTVDKTRYVVSYKIFASNIMPEITVLPL